MRHDYLGMVSKRKKYLVQIRNFLKNVLRLLVWSCWNYHPLDLFLSLPHNIAPLSASLGLKPCSCFPPVPGPLTPPLSGKQDLAAQTVHAGITKPPGRQGQARLELSELCGNGLWVTHRGPNPGLREASCLHPCKRASSFTLCKAVVQPASTACPTHSSVSGG